MVWICLDCKETFEEPAKIEERHGFDYGPFEVFYTCPFCGESFATAYQCAACGEIITDSYIKIDHDRYCSNCYSCYDLGDEE